MLLLDSVSRRFDEKIVVNGVSVEIFEGEFVTLLGPSGCGKTTILKMIGGFLRPSSGRILLDGIDITDTLPENRPVATVFQNYALFPHMTVLENVMYGLRYKDGYNKQTARDAASAILELVHLEEVAGRNVNKISGGQQQRVALARALVLKPRVLLLDEPLSNLDFKLRVKIREEIKEIQRRLGMTMLFVTHDQEEALSLSDRVVVMNNGQAEQIDTPREIYTNPRNIFVANFVGRANLLNVESDTCIVRPENIRPVAEAGDYQGRIVRKQYMGSYTIYSVEVGEMVLQMDVRSTDDYDWGIGRELCLKITPARQFSQRPC